MKHVPAFPSRSRASLPRRTGLGYARWAIVTAGMAACAAPAVVPDGDEAKTESPASQAVTKTLDLSRRTTPVLDPRAIDENKRVTLAGNTHPHANAATSRGALADGEVIEHMQLVLRREAGLETQLQAHIDALHDKTSPVFHQWISARDFGDQYGVAPDDIALVVRWLEGHGFVVDSVPPSRMFIEFTGTVAQIREAFHTQIDRLVVKGVAHMGNRTDPEIPAELSKVIVGVHALHDFMPRSMRKDRGAVKRDGKTGKWSTVSRSPDFTLPTLGACLVASEATDCGSGTCDGTTGACKCTSASQCSGTLSGGAATCKTNSSGTTECLQCASNADCVFPSTCNTSTGVCDETFYAVAPADFATIYNLNPLFAEGNAGAGQTIVVIEDTPLKTVGDVTTFRAAFGLSGQKGTFSQALASGAAATCKALAKPNAAEGEAALDAEWAGAVAPDAAIELAYCKDASTVFGGLLALENLINSATPPPIVSISYGDCELFNGVAGNQSYYNTYQQAAAAGTSVFVSSGDELAASCDGGAGSQFGIQISGFASTPYNVAVGGTDFADNYNAAAGGPAISTYWNTTVNTASPYSSALSYVPEIPWNNSCASKLLYSTPAVALGTYTKADGASGFCNSKIGAFFQEVGGGSGGPSNNATAAGVGWPQPSWQTGVVGIPAKAGGVRTIPDVSLFAANGVWGHFYVFCMSDAAQNGVPCTYTNQVDTLSLAAGGTSFAAPAMAGIQALINQKMGGAQGNPNYTLYKLAANEQGPRGSTRCNASSSTLPDPECIFNDVTAGDIDVNCGQIACTTGTNGNAASVCPYYANPTTAGYQFCSAGVCVFACNTAADCPLAGQACTAGACTPNTAANCYDYSGTTQGILSTSTTASAPAFAAGTGWDYATGLGTVNAYNLVNAWSK